MQPIHKVFREQSKSEFEAYQRELTECAAVKGDKVNMEKPQEPLLKMLVIPAKNSATGLFQILNDNNGKGLIFEMKALDHYFDYLGSQFYDLYHWHGASLWSDYFPFGNNSHCYTDYGRESASE